MDFLAIAIFIPNVAYFIGSCWLFIGILNDSPTLNRHTTNAGASNAVDDTAFKQSFCQMVQFYSDVKELCPISSAVKTKNMQTNKQILNNFFFCRLVNEFNATVEILSLIFFLFTLLNIASTLLIFEAESVEYRAHILILFKDNFNHLAFLFLVCQLQSNLMAAIPSIITAFTLFALCFIVCNFGESVSAQFERFDRRLCNCRWYLYSIKMQRMYLIFVAYTQQSVTLGTFAQIECTRETLKKVCDCYDCICAENLQPNVLKPS